MGQDGLKAERAREALVTGGLGPKNVEKIGYLVLLNCRTQA
jgi:hypothetical protein